jgi:hypothetical protein
VSDYHILFTSLLMQCLELIMHFTNMRFGVMFLKGDPAVDYIKPFLG